MSKLYYNLKDAGSRKTSTRRKIKKQPQFRCIFCQRRLKIKEKPVYQFNELVCNQCKKEFF